MGDMLLKQIAEEHGIALRTLQGAARRCKRKGTLSPRVVYGQEWYDVPKSKLSVLLAEVHDGPGRPRKAAK